MSSKRFLIVPEDSSAASRPLPGATMAKAILLRSARFIDASSESTVSLQVKVDGSQANPQEYANKKIAIENANRKAPIRKRQASAGAAEAGSLRSGRLSRDFRIEFALDITLRHLGGGQHPLDLAGLTRGVEFLQPLFAKFRHRLHRGLEIFARIEFAGILVEHLADLAGHRHPVVGVDVDLADAVLDAALDFRNRHAPGRLHLAAIGVDDVLQV